MAPITKSPLPPEAATPPRRRLPPPRNVRLERKPPWLEISKPIAHVPIKVRRWRTGNTIQEEITRMIHVTYAVVEHDGGWAYKVGDVFSETFPTRALAHAAAERAAREQR